MLKLDSLSACLVSKHRKSKQIHPALNSAFGWQVTAIDKFNTDMLGTFSGECERTLTAIDCAVYKAEKALSLSDNDIGLGSEGSFNPDLYGLMTVNQELLACVHREHGLLAIGQAAKPVNIDTWTLQPQESNKLTSIVDALPTEQALILRLINGESEQGNKYYGDVQKGLINKEQVFAAFNLLTAIDASKAIEVTYDLRAMHCPQRRSTITLAAENLVERLQSNCPNCDAINFYPQKQLPGLPCETCHLPTSVIKAYQAKCAQCGFETTTPVKQKTASTVNCSFCNP